jgi:hypothetical protein
MTQDVTVQSGSANSDNGSGEIVSTIIGNFTTGKNLFENAHDVHRHIRTPRNSMVRLAVLNALRPATCFSRI